MGISRSLHILSQPVATRKHRRHRNRLSEQEPTPVKNTLVSQELRARYLIKASSKHPRLRSYTWEVAKKFDVPAAHTALRYNSGTTDQFSSSQQSEAGPSADDGYFPIFFTSQPSW